MCIYLPIHLSKMTTVWGPWSCALNDLYNYMKALLYSTVINEKIIKLGMGYQLGMGSSVSVDGTENTLCYL